MTDSEYVAIRSRLKQLRTESKDSVYGKVPASIAYLERKLSRTLSHEDKATIYLLLLSEVSREKNDRLELDVLRRRVQDFPDDPLSLSGLAFKLAITQNSRAEALHLAEEAVQVAKKQDRQVRYSATNLARIAILLRDVDKLDQALATLVSDANSARAEDQWYEFDFLDQIDQSAVDTELLARYKRLQK